MAPTLFTFTVPVGGFDVSRQFANGPALLSKAQVLAGASPPGLGVGANRRAKWSEGPQFPCTKMNPFGNMSWGFMLVADRPPVQPFAHTGVPLIDTFALGVGLEPPAAEVVPVDELVDEPPPDDDAAAPDAALAPPCPLAPADVLDPLEHAMTNASVDATPAANPTKVLPILKVSSL